jgi:hypothetical protein
MRTLIRLGRLSRILENFGTRCFFHVDVETTNKVGKKYSFFFLETTQHEGYFVKELKIK